VPVPLQAEDLDPEPVQPGDAAGVQRGDDLLGFAGGLAAAYDPSPTSGSAVRSIPAAAYICAQARYSAVV